MLADSCLPGQVPQRAVPRSQEAPSQPSEGGLETGPSSHPHVGGHGTQTPLKLFCI